MLTEYLDNIKIRAYDNSRTQDKNPFKIKFTNVQPISLMYSSPRIVCSVIFLE